MCARPEYGEPSDLYKPDDLLDDVFRELVMLENCQARARRFGMPVGPPYRRQAGQKETELIVLV